MCEPCEKQKSNGNLRIESCEKTSCNFHLPDSLQQKIKFNKFEDFHCQCCHLLKNQLTVEAQVNEILTHSEATTNKAEKFEDCSIPDQVPGNLRRCDSESERKTDCSKFFLLIENFSVEEINKKFQELNFALKMDFSTIEKRLCFLFRIKNQAEINLEKEFQTFKHRIQNFQLLFESLNLCNKDRLSLISDLNKGIHFLENAVTHLTEIAMAYGYTQHEAEFLKFIFIMIENVKNIENIKDKALKLAERFKGATESGAINLKKKDSDVHSLRRRSFSVSSLEFFLRRSEFAADATPRIPEILSCNKQNVSFIEINKGTDQNLTEARGFSNDPIILCNNDLENNKNTSKKASFQDQCSPSVTEPLAFTQKNNTNITGSIDLKQTKESLKDLGQSLTREESVNVFFCLRKIFRWNVTLLNSTRFRWPENTFQYAQFYISWYIAFVLLLFFMGGFFTGFNGCLVYMSLRNSLYWLAVFTTCILIRKFFRFLIHFFVIIILALIILFFLLTKIILPQLTELETDALLKIVGLIFEVRYLNGPPPI